VSFALPLFQTNNGGKLNALKGVGSQKVATSNNKEMLRIERMNLVTKLKRLLSTLSKMPKLKELENKHLKVEKLFSRGVVSIPMTIESHRQQVEFIKSKFDTENDVLNTYGKILLIDGNITAFEKLL
jgi:cobalt-zinc-cadmium efflux system outer membrane protein